MNFIDCVLKRFTRGTEIRTGVLTAVQDNLLKDYSGLIRIRIDEDWYFCRSGDFGLDSKKLLSALKALEGQGVLTFFVVPSGSRFHILWADAEGTETLCPLNVALDVSRGCKLFLLGTVVLAPCWFIFDDVLTHHHGKFVFILVILAGLFGALMLLFGLLVIASGFDPVGRKAWNDYVAYKKEKYLRMRANA